MIIPYSKVLRKCTTFCGIVAASAYIDTFSTRPAIIHFHYMRIRVSSSLFLESNFTLPDKHDYSPAFCSFFFALNTKFAGEQLRGLFFRNSDVS